MPIASNQQEPLTDGDSGFVGVDMLTPPRLVAPGFASSAKNKRFVNGEAETRRGSIPPVWGQLWSAKFPYRNPNSIIYFPAAGGWADYSESGYAGDIRIGWHVNLVTGSNRTMTCYGVGFFSDPNETGEDWIVRIGENGLYFARETEVGRFVPYASSNLAVSAPAQIVQSFDKLVISRSDGQPTLEWSGNWVDPVREMNRPAPANPIYAMPASLRALSWRERLWVIAGRDELVASQLADNTRYTSDNDFFVNRGSGDSLRALAALGNYSLILFKTRSLHLLTATLADLSDVTIDEVTSDIQFDAPNSVVQVGTEVWWLDNYGIRAGQLLTTADGRRSVGIRLLSQKIEPLIRRINWAYVSRSSAAVWNNRVYFAVPLDQETYPHSVLVFNLLTGEWDGWDNYVGYNSSFNLIGLVVSSWLGAPRLFTVNSTMALHCLEFTLGEDISKQGNENYTSSNNVAPIADELITRGYSCGDATMKKWTRVDVSLDTWNVNYNQSGSGQLVARFDGVSEDLDLGGLNRRPTKFYTLTPDFNLANTDGRFGDANRQDYAWNLASSSSLRVDTTNGGVRLEDFQTAIERRRLNRVRGGFVQLIVRNPQGSVKVTSVSIEALPGFKNVLSQG